MKKAFFTFKIAIIIAFIGSAFTVATKWIYPLEPLSKHYKTLAALSPEPNSTRIALDTMSFPWAEYSRTGLGYSQLRTHYLNAEDEAKLPTLIQFPANSSNQTRAELDYLLNLQAKRTPAEIQRAEYIANIGSWQNIISPVDSEYVENRKQLFYIAGSIGEWYNPTNFPHTTELLMNCILDIRATEFRLKRHFRRARPYHLEPKLQPLARMKSPAFPSGHTLWAFTQAFLFSEIIPQNRANFIEKAEEVRWSRELMGIHYPSDNEASRQIAWNLVNYWYKNPQFVADLEKAQIEWQQKSVVFNKK